MKADNFKVRAALFAVIVLAMVSASVAWALGSKTFQSGDVLDAKTMTDLWSATVANEQAVAAISALDGKVKALEAAVAQPKIAVPKLCGTAGETLNGAAGIPLIKTVCEAKCGNKLGRLCTAADLEVLVAMGTKLPSKATYLAGVSAAVDIGGGKLVNVGNCSHFTDASATVWTFQTSSSGTLGGLKTCDLPGAHLCCSVE